MFAALSAIAIIVHTSPALASGGDDLLKITGHTSAPAVAELTTAAPADTASFRLNDPFTLQFYSAWQGSGKLPPEVDRWAQAVLKGRYDEGARLWGPVQSQIQETFAKPSRAAFIYCLWKLGLSQTFFDEWLQATQVPGFREDRSAAALEQAITPGFDRWLFNQGIVLSSEQKAMVIGWDANRGFVDATLKGYAELRSGEAAEPLLATLPASHALKIPLSETVIVALAKKGDLSGAARVIKEHLEPALVVTGDPKLLAKHELEIARLLYQAGSLEGAEQYYQRVPSGVPDYLSSREELTWVWLRKGDLSHLRGVLQSLESPIYAERFGPEVYLVRAISNLKLCFYDKVAKAFREFVVHNEKWAKQIREAQSGPTDRPPPDPDFYTQLLERSYRNLQAELPRISWWKQSADVVQADLATVAKQRSAEYRRQWHNREVILTEAIRKMKFVRVEFLSQVRQLEDSDKIRVSAAAPARTLDELTPADKTEARKLASEGDMSFAFDGSYWADEVFRLRALTRGICLQ